MKMKKYLSIAILLMLMATPLVFTSCGGDDLVASQDKRPISLSQSIIFKELAIMTSYV